MGEGKVGGVDWGRAGDAVRATLASAAIVGTVAAAAAPTKAVIGETEDRPGIALLHSVSDMVEQDNAAHRLGEDMVDGASPVAEPESAEHADPPEGSTFFASASGKDTASDLADAAEAADQMAADLDMSGDLGDGGPGFA